MNFVIENWPYAVGILVAGFILGVLFRILARACSALMNFEYTQEQAQRQADFIKREYDRVMGQTRDTETLKHLQQRVSELGLEVERIRRGLGQ